MRALWVNGQVIEADPNKSDWHFDILTRFMKDQNLTEDQINQMIESKEIVFGHINYYTKEFLESSCGLQYGSVDEAHSSAYPEEYAEQLKQRQALTETKSVVREV